MFDDGKQKDPVLRDFSYYETMLNEFVLYYKIANNATLPSQILDSILKAYKTKYGEEITCIEENVEYANSFYRLLRNLYMHGSLSKERIDVRYSIMLELPMV